MDRDPEDRHLVSLMLGYQIIIEYMAGPSVTDDNFGQVVEAGEVLTGQSEARTRAVYLQMYSNFGIEVTPTEERKDYIFIPWGSVLRIWGQDRPELEQAEREAMQREQSEEGSPT